MMPGHGDEEGQGDSSPLLVSTRMITDR